MIILIEKIFPAFKGKIGEVFQSVLKWFEQLWNKIKGIFNRIGKFLGLVSETDATVKLELEGAGLDDIIDEDIDTPKGDKSSPTFNPSAVLFPPSGGGVATQIKPSAITGAGAASGGGGGKSITVTLDITNVFNSSGDGDFERNKDRYVDYIMSKVNNTINDTMIQHG